MFKPENYLIWPIAAVILSALIQSEADPYARSTYELIRLTQCVVGALLVGLLPWAILNAIPTKKEKTNEGE